MNRGRNATGTAQFSFLTDGGVCARLIGVRDWSDTRLGPISEWPPGLKILLGTLLRSPLPMILFWGEGFIFFCNDKMRERIGDLSALPRLGDSISDVWPGVTVALQHFSNGTRSPKDHIILPMGAYSATVVHDENGSPSGILAILQRETSGGLRASETNAELKEMHERLELISKATQDAIWDWDLASDNLWWSEGFKTLFNYTDKEMEAGIESWFNRIHPRERQSVVDSIHRAIDTGQREWSYRYRFRKGDGSYAYVADRGHILLDENKTPYRMVGAMHDITARRNVERRLEEVSAQNSEMSSLLESIFKNAPIGFALFNQRHEYLHVNDALAEIDGLPGEDHLGKTITDVLPESSAALSEIIDRVFETKQPTLNVEVKGRPLGTRGAERTWLTSFFPVLIGSGESRYVGAAVMEITDRIKAEETLREREKQFRDFSNHIQNLAWTADASGEIYWYNKRWYDYTGVRWEDMKLSGWSSVLHPHDTERVTGFVRSAWQKGEEWELKFPLKRQDGVYRWFLTRAYPIKDNNGRIMRWIGTSTDIDGEIEVQRQLQQNEDTLRLISDFMPQIVWSTDPQGYHDFFNKRWYEFTGLTYQDTEGEGWMQVLHPADVNATMEVWQRSLRSGTVYETAYRMRRYDGEYRWLLARAIPLRLANGSIERWFGTCTDIHDQKTIAEKLDELVRERTKALQRSNEDLQQFAHVASHDLKEPVRKIRVFEAVITEQFGDVLPEQVKNYLTKIRNSANRIFSMIEGVLLYSSVEGTSAKNEWIDLNALIDEIMADLDLLIAEKKAVVRHRQLPRVNGSPTLIYQLFYNLINNSLKFSDPKKDLLIELHARRVQTKGRDFNEIILADTGIGFNEKYAEAIFGTFTRLNTKDRFEGSGLGLALCKKIVERHGGSISAAGREGVGATFTIRLPVS